MKNNKLIDLTEFNKAAKMLRDKGIKYLREDSGAIMPDGDVYERHGIHSEGEWVWDFVCHTGTYGSEDGLLEYWSKKLKSSGCDPKGWLTAEEVVRLIEEGE